jgi:hypothetical protein
LPARSSDNGPGISIRAHNRDRYQEALQQLIEAKMKGRTIKAPIAPAPSPVIDLMAALERSLAQEQPAAKRATATTTKTAKVTPDRRQKAMLLPLSSRQKQKTEPTTETSIRAASRRKKA